MTTSICPPVIFDGWGGASSGCATVAEAHAVLIAIEGAVRGAFPEQWRSSAADEFVSRLGDLLRHTDLLGALIVTAHERAADFAAAVELARGKPS